jgi:peptidoglycan/LPS O-acetylase OafA/YrhL
MKISALESIRGLAATLVVLCHLPKWNSFLDITFINNGYLMVDLFFVLSGFVICNAYSEKITDTKDLIRFQFLRFGRLYPVHLIFLLVFLAIEIAKYFASVQLGIHSPNSLPFETNNISTFIKNIFLISSILPGEPLTYNAPAWSISVEFYTYLLFAISILVFKKMKGVVFSGYVVISVLMLATGTTLGFELLLRCLAGFFIGCLTSRLSKSLNLSVPSFVGVCTAVVLVLFLQFKTNKVYDLLIYFLTAGLILSIVNSNNRALNKALNGRLLIWLGTISYSIYMSHFAIVWFANQVIRVVLKKPEIIDIDGKSLPQLTQAEAVVASLVVGAAVLLVSAFVYSYVEKPLREKSRRFALSRLKS